MNFTHNFTHNQRIIPPHQPQCEAVFCEFVDIIQTLFNGWYNAEIISRDYDGIIEELNAAISTAYAEAASNLCKQMKAGYH